MKLTKKLKKLLQRVEEGMTTEKDAKKLRKLFKKMRHRKLAKKNDEYLYLEILTDL